MKRDGIDIFYVFATTPIQAFFTIICLVLIFLRVRSIRNTNRMFPSRWRTASTALIITSGIFAIIYIVLSVVRVVLGTKTWNIADRKNIAEAALTFDDFTSNEITYIVGSYNKQTMVNITRNKQRMPLWDVCRLTAFELAMAARSVLTIALWLSKLAFISFFWGQQSYLPKAQWLVLQFSSTVVILSFAASIWATFWTFKSWNSYTVNMMIPLELWRGVAYRWLGAPFEYMLGGLNIAVDILLTAMACYIVKMLPGSSGGVPLLIGMLSATIATAIFHLVAYAITEGPEISTAAIDAALVFMSDFEVILSIIVSCIPGARAWTREQVAKKQLHDPETRVLGGSSEGSVELQILRED